MADLVTLTIDDKSVTVPAGTLVVDAAKAAGIEIPVFCSHPKLDPLGACRMCLVEFVGPRGSKLDTSCTVRVVNGMVVRTDTEQVKSAREAVLGFILTNHPLDCPICDKGGECPLQDQTMAYGPGVSQFVEPKRRKQKHYPISELITLDQERCILCWRCVRYLEEWEDKPQLGLFQRGGETCIDIFPGNPLDAKTSGSIIDICPVGALTNRVDRFRYRPWELTETPSICTLCAVGCNVRLDERVHELRRIVARENPAVNDEWICDKGRFAHQYIDHGERLDTPLVRDGDTLRPATWEEALGRVVEHFGSVLDSHGSTAVGGVTSGRVSNEAAYLFQKFFRTHLGTNNVDFAGGSAVRAVPTGLNSIAELGKSDVVVLVDLDLAEVAPILDLQLKRAIRRAGARLVVINSQRIEASAYVDDPRVQGGALLAMRPGSEVALLEGVASAVLAKRHAEDPRRSSGLAGVARNDEWATLRSLKLDNVAAETGVDVASITRAAQLLAGAKSPLFLYGQDAASGVDGSTRVSALANLALLLGFGDRLAFVGAEANSQGLRDMGVLPDLLPGQSPVSDAAVRERLGKLWGVQPASAPGHSYRQMLSGAVRALWVMGEDPAAVPQVAEALGKLDFLVVQDLFMTATAALADVVLPAASSAEADGTFTNVERRVQRARQGIRPVGQSQPDWLIIQRLAEAWLDTRYDEGEPEPEHDWKRKRRRSRAVAAPKAWNYPSVQSVLDEIGKAVPAYAGMQWSALGDAGLQWPLTALSRPARRYEPRQGSQKPATGAETLLLVSASLLWDDGYAVHYGAAPVRRLCPEPFVALNPLDCTRLAVTEGDTVVVASSRSSVRLPLRCDESVRAGSVFIPYRLAGRPAETLGAGEGDAVLVSIGRAAE